MAEMGAPRRRIRTGLVPRPRRHGGGGAVARLLAAALVSLLCVAGSTVAAAADTGRVIVKYRASAFLLRQQALSAGAAQVARAQAMATRLGMALAAGAAVSDRSEVLTAAGVTSEVLAARLAAQPDVEYAVPDARVQALAAPSDTIYVTGPPVVSGRGGPVAGQWYLRAPAGEVQSGLDLEAAWDITYGHPSVVVAVVDTGVRFDHPDLLSVAAGGNLLPGFDMISDVPTAGDGNGRDADASDPGDFVTLSEVTTICGGGCSPSNSSWHGTQVSGLVAATTDNGTGIASTGRSLRVLPVRVLGKGGGFDSDVLAGLRWAGGLGVAGVPANPTPARVVNVSLGSRSACSAAYQDTIDELAAAGVLVVVAAGNSVGHAVGSPGNCAGAFTVTALRHAGTKVGFSDLGPEIALSAPGGNCVDIGPGDACRFPIATTSNAGTSFPIPGAAGAILTDSFNVTLGTSFSAPLVSGVAGLLLSARPDLTLDDLRAALLAGVRPFPTTGADNGDGTIVPQCLAPRPIHLTQFDQLQCYCTTGTCGAGMLDAGLALAGVSALRARIGATPVVARAGQPVVFEAAGSVLPPEQSVAAFAWRVIDGGGIAGGIAPAADGEAVAVVPAAAGSFVVGLTLTDSSGARSTTERRVQVASSGGHLLDVDANGSAEALSDGLLVLRRLLGLSGESLTAGAIGSGAQRASAAAIAAYVDALGLQLDVDADGGLDGGTDGVLVLRYLLGFAGDALTGQALGTGAMRTAPAAVSAYLDAFAE